MLIQRLTHRGCREDSSTKAEAEIRASLAAIAEEALRHARAASAPASRRQDHHGLEWPDDLRLRARRAGARRPGVSRMPRKRAAQFHPRASLEGRPAPAQLPPGRERGRRFCDDYASLIQGLLDLYEADFDIGWICNGRSSSRQKQDELFLDAEHGGYFSVRCGRDPHILLRMKEDYDGAEPSPNSVAALNLLRLGQMTDDSLHARACRKNHSRLCPAAFAAADGDATDACRARFFASETEADSDHWKSWSARCAGAFA